MDDFAFRLEPIVRETRFPVTPEEHVAAYVEFLKTLEYRALDWPCLGYVKMGEGQYILSCGVGVMVHAVVPEQHAANAVAVIAHLRAA